MKPESAAALVLAAGFSKRMGDFKPLMMLGGMTILERVVRLFQFVGVHRIHVVVGHRAAEVTPRAHQLGARSVFNSRHAEGMFSSVLAGVESLDEATESFFVLPVDIPLVRPATLRILMESSQAHAAAIYHPTFQGRRGHPPLIHAALTAAIADWQGEGGLKSLLERFEAEAADIPVVDEFILEDMDSPHDHRRLDERMNTQDILSPAECEALLVERLKAPPAVLAHGSAVADQALHIGRALVAAGCRLNLDLIYAAALVHDMARGEPDHARRGGSILRDLDMPQMAEIVETHMNLCVGKEDPVREAEVVFLADKLICEDRLVGLDGRFLPRLNEHRTDPGVQDSVRLKLEAARRSAQRIESVIGRSLASLSPEMGKPTHALMNTIVEF